MSRSFVRIGMFENSTEAHAARAALEVAGIASFVDGDAAATALNHIGSALGGIKLRVAAEDAEAASRIIHPQDDADSQNKKKTAWRCPQCSESVEAGFEVCWSCGTSRTGEPDPTFSTDDAQPTNPTRATASMAETVEVEADDWSKSDPTENDQPMADAAQEEWNGLVLRAWRAAIIGLVFCPGAFHLYSAVLLVQASGIPCESSGPMRVRAWGAAFIDIVVLSIIVTFAVRSFR